MYVQFIKLFDAFIHPFFKIHAHSVESLSIFFILLILLILIFNAYALPQVNLFFLHI